MRKHFAKRPLRQRAIALVAAYAIALTNLIAGLGAAQAAAQAAAQEAAQATAHATTDGGTGIICHSDLGGSGPAPGSDENNSTICLKCCIGCMASPATITPPTVTAAAPPQLSFKRLDLPAFSLRPAGARSKAHRSRGPPPAL